MGSTTPSSNYFYWVKTKDLRADGTIRVWLSFFTGGSRSELFIWVWHWWECRVHSAPSAGSVHVHLCTNTIIYCLRRRASHWGIIQDYWEQLLRIFPHFNHNSRVFLQLRTIAQIIEKKYSKEQCNVNRICLPKCFTIRQIKIFRQAMRCHTSHWGPSLQVKKYKLIAIIVYSCGREAISFFCPLSL